MRARVAVAGLLHETNTFSPIPTTMRDFLSGNIGGGGYLRGDELLSFAEEEKNSACSGFLRSAGALGLEPVPIAWAEAQPSGMMSESTFDEVMEPIERGLRAGGPYEAVYLDLHGALLYGDYRNGEEEILRRVRSIVGDVPVAASLDLHANLSDGAVGLASALVACRTYPHVDLYETGARAAVAIRRCLDGAVSLPAFRRLPFLMPTSSQASGREPCSSLFSLLDAGAADSRLVAASLLLGFPPSDTPFCGPSVAVYGEPGAAADLADRIVAAALDREGLFESRLVPYPEAVARAMEATAGGERGPVILADVQDNPGGGSGSDSVWILEELVRRGAEGAAVGMLYDPEAVDRAFEAGLGSTIELELGGRALPGHRPFRSAFRVEGLHDGPVRCQGPMARGMVVDLGGMALLRVGGVLVSVGSMRIQAADRAVFTVFGLDPATLRILSLKSFVHFEADFGPMASEILRVEAPGAEFDDPGKVEYHRLREGLRLWGKGRVYHG